MKRNDKGVNTLLTTEEFLFSLPDKFKDKYDYTETVYKGCKSLIYYICPLHGEVKMSASKHKSSKYGCNTCASLYGSKRKKSTAGVAFVNKCKTLYGDQFDYSYIEYFDTKTKVKFVCKDHGVLYELPMYARRYNPCKDCRDLVNVNINRKPEQQVRQESLTKFDVEFDFDFTNYTNCNSLINIKCPSHGWFENKLSNHFNSLKGCSKCLVEWVDRPSTKNSVEDNITKLYELYGDRFCFFTEDIGLSKEHVRYYCKRHRRLKSTALHHLRCGFACNQCGDEVMATKLKGMYSFKLIEENKEDFLNQDNNLYVFNLSEGLYKIGMSVAPENRNTSVKSASGFKESKILCTWAMNTYDTFHLEQHIQRLLIDYRYYSQYAWGGHTEVFEVTEDMLQEIVEYINNKVNNNE